MSKFSFGKTLIAVGALCIAFAIGLTGYNIWDTQRASESVEKAVGEISEHLPETIVPAEAFAPEKLLALNNSDPEIDVPFFVVNPEIEMLEEVIDGTAYIGTLEFPTLELALPVISRWSEENGRIGPCRYSGSVYLDNLILCAHNYIGHFGRISSLSVGDEVLFTDMEGTQFKYSVCEFEVLDDNAVEEIQLGGWDLTLFTCTMSGTSRITVRCEKV